MNKDQDTLDIVDLGAASEVTLGHGLSGPEAQGFPKPAGISDVD